MSFTITKGQGATEYLVLLAVVLIVAMVAIALLGFFPGMSYDAKKSESDTYWTGQAKPIEILNHDLSADGILRLVLVNVQGDSLLIDNISIAGSGINGTSSGQFYLASGQSTRISLDMGPSFTPGAVYEFGVNISYADPDQDNLKQTQFGAEPLIGKASDTMARVNSSSGATCSGCMVCENDVCRACRGSECD